MSHHVGLLFFTCCGWLANSMEQREYGHADLIPQRHGGHVDQLFEGIEGSMEVVRSSLHCAPRSQLAF